MSDAPLCVAGIGASAGGIEAFHHFFEKMPPDSGLALVVVLHLAAGHKSMLPEIIARWTAMKVTEASDGEAVVADHVLVVPPGAVARLEDGRLSIRQVTSDAPRDTAPIDALFDSMAASLNEDAIGVILSGTGHDGALGLKAIKARGGLTLAQSNNGSGPEYPGMPDSAVAAGAVDLHVPGRTAVAIFHRRRWRLRGPARCSGTLHLLGPQPDPRSAILPDRPDLLPQSADLYG